MSQRMRVPDLIRMRERGERITMLTAYDYTFARLADRAGVDIVLVGDSLGSVVQGKEDTLAVTLEEIIYHTAAVVRGVENALVIADMPFMSYQLGPKEALQAAGRIVKESGAHGVKLEGGAPFSDTITAIVAAGIPVMAHVGLMPQSVHAIGGYRVQGRSSEQAKRIFDDARAVSEAGAFAIVLEGIPKDLAKEVTESTEVPTIGIGAGAACSGQVLVGYDMLGLTNFPSGAPKFLKQYRSLADDVISAIQEFRMEVIQGSFPSDDESYS